MIHAEVTMRVWNDSNSYSQDTLIQSRVEQGTTETDARSTGKLFTRVADQALEEALRQLSDLRRIELKADNDG